MHKHVQFMDTNTHKYTINKTYGTHMKKKLLKTNGINVIVTITVCKFTSRQEEHKIKLIQTVVGIVCLTCFVSSAIALMTLQVLPLWHPYICKLFITHCTHTDTKTQCKHVNPPLPGSLMSAHQKKSNLFNWCSLSSECFKLTTVQLPLSLSHSLLNIFQSLSQNPVTY